MIFSVYSEQNESEQTSNDDNLFALEIERHTRKKNKGIRHKTITIKIAMNATKKKRKSKISQITIFI